MSAAAAPVVPHVGCPTDCDVPWLKCPWCGTYGVPHATMRECRSWYKADREHDCANCSCDHKDKPEPHFYDTFMHHEPCPMQCTEFVKPLSPCQQWLQKPGWA